MRTNLNSGYNSTGSSSTRTEDSTGISHSGHAHIGGGSRSHPLSTATFLTMTPAKDSNRANSTMPVETSNSLTSRNSNSPPVTGGPSIVRASTPVQQNQQGPGNPLFPTTPQRQIQPSMFIASNINNNTPRNGHFNPFLRNSGSGNGSNHVPLVNTNIGSHAFSSYSANTNSAATGNPASAFNRPLRHSSLHQVTLPQTPDSSPVSPMSFSTLGGVQTPTMNAPSYGIHNRESVPPSSSTGYFNGVGSVAPSTRYNAGWPLSRTRSHDSPTATFNYGPSSSVSSLGLESGFMLDRNSEQSSSSDEEYNGGYDSDDLMSMGSRRQSLSTPHFMPVFRSDTNSSSNSSLTNKMESGNNSMRSTGGSNQRSIITQRSDSSLSNFDTQPDPQEMGGSRDNNNRQERYRYMSATSDTDTGPNNNSSDGSAIKNFLSTFRPDTKRSLLGGHKKSPISPSSMGSFFGSPSRKGLSEGNDLDQPAMTFKESSSRFSAKRFSAIITKNHENKRSEKHNEINESNGNSPSSHDHNIYTNDNDTKKQLNTTNKSLVGNSSESSSSLEYKPTDGRTAIRRFVSDGRSLRPKVKSFLRISRDLQDEMSPLDTEIKQEARVTTALRDDGTPETYYHHPFATGVTAYQSSPTVSMSANKDLSDSHKNKATSKVDSKPSSSISSSFAPIQQQQYPQRRHSLIRSDSIKSGTISSDAELTDNEAPFSLHSPGSTSARLATATPSVKRKASIMEDTMEPSFLKRRAVSPGYVSPIIGSPTSGTLGPKRNIKHLRDTSDGFEKMSLA